MEKMVEITEFIKKTEKNKNEKIENRIAESME